MHFLSKEELFKVTEIPIKRRWVGITVFVKKLRYAVVNTKLELFLMLFPEWNVYTLLYILHNKYVHSYIIIRLDILYTYNYATHKTENRRKGTVPRVSATNESTTTYRNLSHDYSVHSSLLIVFNFKQSSLMRSLVHKKRIEIRSKLYFWVIVIPLLRQVSVTRII